MERPYNSMALWGELKCLVMCIRVLQELHWPTSVTHCSAAPSGNKCPAQMAGLSSIRRPLWMQLLRT